MPETNDRVEMPLDEVIKKDWTGDSKPRGGKGGKVLGRGKAAGRGRGLVRRNPIMTKVRRTPAKGAVEKGGKGKGRFHWVPKGDVAARQSNDRAPAGKGKGRTKGGTFLGRGLNLWRGARVTNAERRAGKGKSKGKGQSKGIKGSGKGSSKGSKGSKGKTRLGQSWNTRRWVNRSTTFVKRSQTSSWSKGQGKGKKGSGKTKAISTYSGAGKGSYGSYGSYGSGKGKSKGKSYNGSGTYSDGASSYRGGGYSGGGSWGQERNQDRDSWGFDNYSKGGKGSRDTSPRASEQLSAEDKRMMKKITVVAQLDKVPKPHPAMQGLRQRATGGDTGSLSSRFGANFRR